MAFCLKLLPTLITIPSIITMLVLGTWQMDRLSWKQSLIDLLDARTTADAIVLPDGDLSQADDEFRPIFTEGHYDYSTEFLLQNRTYEKQAGMHVLTPFIRADGKGSLLVDRGWVPFELSDPTYRLNGQIDGITRLEGVIRFPIGQTSFVPDNTAEKDQWYYIALDQMGAQSGYGFAPYYIMADDTGNQNVLPIGGQWKVSLPNNHLEYALTWYLLALILLVIFVLFHREKL